MIILKELFWKKNNECINNTENFETLLKTLGFTENNINEEINEIIIKDGLTYSKRDEDKDGYYKVFTIYKDKNKLEEFWFLQ